MVMVVVTITILVTLVKDLNTILKFAENKIYIPAKESDGGERNSNNQGLVRI